MVGKAVAPTSDRLFTSHTRVFADRCWLTPGGWLRDRTGGRTWLPPPVLLSWGTVVCIDAAGRQGLQGKMQPRKNSPQTAQRDRAKGRPCYSRAVHRRAWLARLAPDFMLLYGIKGEARG